MVILVSAFLPFANIALSADTAGNSEKPADQPKPAVHTDLYGDPLPPGALMRFGTTRFRHDDGIHDAVISADGLTIAAAARTGTQKYPKPDDVIAWDTRSGRQVAAIKTNTPSRIISLGLSRNGQFVAAAEQEIPPLQQDMNSELGEAPHRITIYDTKSRKPLHVFPVPHDVYLSRLVFSDDSKVLVVASQNMIWVNELATGNEIWRWEMPLNPDRRVPRSKVVFAASTPLSAVAFVDDANVLRVVSIRDGQTEVGMAKKYDKHLRVLQVTFSPNGEHLGIVTQMANEPNGT